MTEIEDLIGIYGAIDQAVVADPSLVEVVAPFLGPYRNGAAGWFDEFTTWTGRRLATGPSDLFPSLEVALRDLHEIAPRGRMRARRLLAVAVASRVFKHLSVVGSDVDLVLGALSVESLAPDDDDDRALKLLRVLTDDKLFGALSQWSEMIDAAFEQSLISASTAMQGSAPPCSGQLVMVQLPGDPDPVPTLQSHFCTDQLTLEQAKRFLEPVNWPNCNPLWCEMTPLGVSAAGNPTYHEVVSVSCPHKDQVWTAEACLEFKMINVPNGAIVSYDLCEGHPTPGALILVDSGSLAVLQEGSEVCVYTTKRILFDHPFSGPSLAMLSCALGYGAVAEDLVFNCALDPDQPVGGTEFPGTDPPTIEPGGQPVVKQPRKPRQPATSPQPEGQAAVKDAVDEAVDAAKQCVDDCTDAYQASYGKVMSGSYKADDLVNDMSKMWTRMVRDAALVLDIGMKATRAAAAAPERERESDEATSGDDG